MSHINKIVVIQAKIFRTIVNAPWYVRNEYNAGIWESQRSRKKLADTQKNTNQE